MILFGSSVTSLAYIYIFKVVRYHRGHMHNQLRFSNSEARKAFREKKSLFTGFVVYIVFLVLRFPHFCVVILRLSPRFEASFLVVNHLTLSITLLNSSLNPVIYCWRYREIREKTKNIIRKLFGCQKNEMRVLQFFKVKILTSNNQRLEKCVGCVLSLYNLDLRVSLFFLVDHLLQAWS